MWIMEHKGLAASLGLVVTAMLLAPVMGNEDANDVTGRASAALGVDARVSGTGTVDAGADTRGGDASGSAKASANATPAAPPAQGGGTSPGTGADSGADLGLGVGGSLGGDLSLAASASGDASADVAADSGSASVDASSSSLALEGSAPSVEDARVHGVATGSATAGETTVDGRTAAELTDEKAQANTDLGVAGEHADGAVQGGLGATGP